MAEGQVTEPNPIINDPYVEPTRHWEFGEGEPGHQEGRRASRLPAASQDGRQLTITDELIPIDLVNDIRERVRRWREEGIRARPRSRASCSTAGSTPSGSRACGRSSPSGRRSRRSPSSPRRQPTALSGIDIPVVRGVRALGDQARHRHRQDAGHGDGDRLVGTEQGREQAGHALRRRVPRRLPEPHREGAAARADGPARRPRQSVYARVQPDPRQLLAGLFGQVRVLVTNWHQLAPRGPTPRRCVREAWARESTPRSASACSADSATSAGSWCSNDEAHHAWRPPPGLMPTGEEEGGRAGDGLARRARQRSPRPRDPPLRSTSRRRRCIRARSRREGRGSRSSGSSPTSRWSTRSSRVS